MIDFAFIWNTINYKYANPTIPQIVQIFYDYLKEHEDELPIFLEKKVTKDEFLQYLSNEYLKQRKITKSSMQKSYMTAEFLIKTFKEYHLMKTAVSPAKSETAKITENQKKPVQLSIYDLPDYKK